MSNMDVRQLADGLWVADDVLPLPGGLRLPVRMTVVRLSDGGLWLHSPLRATDARVQAVTALGPVRHVVAPNCLHHLYAGQWKDRFPEAQLRGPAGLRRKRPDLVLDGLLDEPAPWGAELDQVMCQGSPRVQESVFLHRPSRSLIVTDFLFNVTKPANVMSRLILGMTGTAGRLAQSRLWRLGIKDRQAAQQSQEKVLAWEFDRLIPAHGDVLETGAQGRVREVIGQRPAG